VIGITGTNGKTTSTFLIENILRANKKTCGVIGTVNYRIDGEEWPAPNTTPFSIDVHRFLALMVEKKVDAGVMEVSSHALAMNRVDDVRFTVGVFMNLTQDHLDYHQTMEKYFLAKQRLFTDFLWRTDKKPCWAIVVTTSFLDHRAGIRW
jgi:UDP-N-acetylmuramoyl-L-alanyl-D-glutamate--2,6-diaminopimelate ligase